MEIRRRQLPHWYEPRQRYFITIRCAGSLPQEVIERYQALLEENPDPVQNYDFRESAFEVLEKYLDQGLGFAPFISQEICEAMTEELRKISNEDFPMVHWVVMPNHLHLLTDVLKFKTIQDFSNGLKRIKGRSGLRLNRLLKRQGAFWQREWYDHWVRDDRGWEFYKKYIFQNPVKARLVGNSSDYPWIQ